MRVTPRYLATRKALFTQFAPQRFHIFRHKNGSGATGAAYRPTFTPIRLRTATRVSAARRIWAVSRKTGRPGRDGLSSRVPPLVAEAEREVARRQRLRIERNLVK